ncbi:hypothetical protein IFU08_09305 [Microbacterium sp. CFBP 8790]|uniref:hypothetical protein n=1 Tax=unclassified Microbacterium TaxID=2609290 RepID=UPI001783CF48|nr:MULTISPECIES: hypothetical protein [unclassified Microbacterium]MBD8205181.1 hypothetical protein [Microbacterium sp. CFBP 8801]MBD8509764.1 hypothetical protein [Microbacterium sp. CFBP 8790]
MHPLLDDEKLSGPREVRISARPAREVIPVRDIDTFVTAVERACQVWGGAADPIVPVGREGEVSDLYRVKLHGSNVDRVVGSRVNRMDFRPLAPDSPPEMSFWGRQLALGLLPYRKQAQQPTLEIIELSADDPWRAIYAACLGALPHDIDPRLVEQGKWVSDLTFDDFVEVNRVLARGNLADLRTRAGEVTRDVSTPRRSSMLSLGYGASNVMALGATDPLLPDANFLKRHYGPDVLVVCAPDAVEDVALLWNLRAAHGDRYTLPIGIPLHEFNAQSLEEVLDDPGVGRLRMSRSRRILVTSATVPTEQLMDLASPDGAEIENVVFADQVEVLDFGRVFGWSRDEVIVWANGSARYTALDTSTERELRRERNLSDVLRFQFDLEVPDSPIPEADDFRVDTGGESFHGGVRSVWMSLSRSDRVRQVTWPSRSVLARSVASTRGLDVRESVPGTAASTLLRGVGGLLELGHLCHAPLLNLLEEMSTRQGFAWYRDRLRRNGTEASPGDAVADAVEELPSYTSHRFKKALGNSTAATKWWLQWAERAELIVKGFSVACVECGAKQWLPVDSFSPPIRCHGCGREIRSPFGNRTSLEFEYRLSERLRRVYEADAMGHLLVARYLYGIIMGYQGDRLIGMHPGTEVLRDGRVVGEADVLLLTRSAEFIPVEVKRTSAGLVPSEIDKLDTLCLELESPWSAIAVCQYARDAGEAMLSLQLKNSDNTYRRLVLTLDHLLEPAPIWTVSSDPFAWTPLDPQAIAEREDEFVRITAARETSDFEHWKDESMLRAARSSMSARHPSGG